MKKAVALAGDALPDGQAVLNSARLPKPLRGNKIWTREPLEGKRILVYANQGMGDAIQWARFLPGLKKLGAEVVLACQKPLVDLFRENDLADKIITRKGPYPDFDFVVPMSALAFRFSAYGDLPAKPGSGPATGSYLQASPARIQKFETIFSASPGLKVGLIWSGNPKNPVDRDRSMPSVNLLPLLDNAGVQFFSLQKDPRANDPLLFDKRFISLADKLKSFADTAAIIAHLDLVLSVDTATAHLTGALGAKGAVLLPFNPDARWPRSGEKTPLYDNLSTYRQAKRDSWSSLMPRISAMLSLETRRRRQDGEAVAGSAKTPARQPSNTMLETGSKRIKQCRYGLMTYLKTDIYIGRSFDRYGEFSELEVEVFRQVLTPGAVVLDVGANIGAHSVFFAHAVGPHGKVLAFEPQKTIFELLCANTALNSLDNIHAHQVALGEQSGKATVAQLNYNTEGNFGDVALASNPTGNAVTVKTIDSFELQRCDFIKIDVEGMEAEVLAGAYKTIQQYRPCLYVENDRVEGSPDLIRLLRKLGYRLYWHLPPLFNPKNFFGEAENIFGPMVSCNLLCFHSSKKQAIKGLKEVSGPGDWPAGLSKPVAAKKATMGSGVLKNRGSKKAPDKLRRRLSAALKKHQAGKVAEAKLVYEAVLLKDPNHASALHLLGLVYFDENNLDRAHELISKALRLDPDDPYFHHNMGTVLSFLGDREQAKRHFRKAIDLKPDYAEAFHSLSAVLKLKQATPIIERVETMAVKPSLPAADQIYLHFAAGKFLDDIGEYDRAFAHFQKGNNAKRATLKSASVARYGKAIHSILTTDFVQSKIRKGLRSQIPVFVVGMPRSGTSLVEQILASHSKVFGAGEIPDIAAISHNLKKHNSQNQSYPMALTQVSDDLLPGLGKAYIERLRELAPKASRIVNKMPHNFWHLGLIACMFPKAKIIHCRRDPIDVCLSCYFQNFSNGQEYSYDFASLAAFYLEYDRMMQHWRRNLPMQFLEVNYEGLVMDPEEGCRQLIEFCGLDWEDACLDFHKTDRVVRTASAWQVRQPVYRSSVKRWKNYERHLGPLISALGPHAQKT